MTRRTSAPRHQRPLVVDSHGGNARSKEAYAKNTPFSGFALERYRTQLHLGQVFDDGEPQPGAPHFSRAGSVHAVKPLKNSALMLARNSDPIVLNFEHHVRPFVFPAHTDSPSFAGVLDRVGHEIIDDLPEGLFVGLHRQVLLVRRHQQLDMLFLGRLFMLFHAQSHDLGEWQRGHFIRFVPGLDTGEAEHILNQFSQPLGLSFDLGNEMDSVVGIVQRSRSSVSA